MSELDDRAQLGARLKIEREYRGYSQEEVASYLGISRSAVSLIESGGRGLDILELKKLATLYECEIQQLTGEQTTPLPASDSVQSLARAAAALSDEDRSEVLRFAQFLQSRKSTKPE